MAGGHHIIMFQAVSQLKLNKVFHKYEMIQFWKDAKVQ